MFARASCSNMLYLIRDFGALLVHLIWIYTGAIIELLRFGWKWVLNKNGLWSITDLHMWDIHGLGDIKNNNKKDRNVK